MTRRPAPGRARRVGGGVAIALVLAVVAVATWWSQPASTTGTLVQQAYVWQRQWDEPVRDAVRGHGGAFERVVVLGAELTLGEGEPGAVRVAVDHASLRALDRPVGVALRIGPYAGPFGAGDAAGRAVVEEARWLVRSMRAEGIEPAELQLDFDAATRHLAGYREWVRAVREAVAPTPVTITALPSWMGSRDFGPLVRATDGYVLQVHALERPERVDAPVTLADPAEARRWAWQAARFDVPFYVALPTYGYVLAFDEAGRFVGLNAEGPTPDWPAGTQLRELAADPTAMAELVRAWRDRRPMMMQGVIWYRLPTARDRRNWRWPTLEAVMAGRTPTPRLTVEPVMDETGLVDVVLVNAGSADATLDGPVTLRWPANARPIARDVLAGFRWRRDDSGRAALTPPAGEPAWKLRAGERVEIAWMRFTQDTEVEAHVQADEP